MRSVQLIMGLLGLVSTPLLGANSLNFCYDQDADTPWVARERPGLALRMATLVGMDLGQPVTLTGLPATRCLLDVKSGRFHGALGIGYSEERLTYGHFPLDASGKLDQGKRMYTEQYVVVRPKGSAVAWDGRKMRPNNLIVAATNQFPIVTTLRRMGTMVDDGGKNIETVLRKVQQQRVDAAVVLANAARPELASQPEFADTLEIAPVPFEERTYYVLLGYDFGPASGKRIWDAVERVRLSGEFALQQKAFFAGR